MVMNQRCECTNTSQYRESSSMNVAALYKETTVTTQTQGKLIVLLYDGAINFLKNAADCMTCGDIEGKARAIGKARDIVFELNNSLNLDSGGTISQNLRALYNFIWRDLGQANISNDLGRIEKIVQILSDLRASWQQIAA